MPDNESRTIANPGSALGEAVGALIEREVNRLLRPIAEDNGCVYLTAGRPNPRTGRLTKLLLKDAAGNDYNIDAVIANPQIQPLVLIESKYIRYKKHNRDKGSWICTAHYSLRRTFPTVRKSFAVLAGSWSGSSKAMMRDCGIHPLHIGNRAIERVLADYGVKYRESEDEQTRAIDAWQHWERLNDSAYESIGRKLLTMIGPELCFRVHRSFAGSCK